LFIICYSYIIFPLQKTLIKLYVNIIFVCISYEIKKTKEVFSIGCEQQERFRSLYSTINKSQYHILSTSTSYHPSLLLFIIRKPGAGDLSSLLDCHVFVVYRESIAFELCDMIRKLIIKQTMSPLPPKRTALVHIQNKQTKSLERDGIEHQKVRNKIEQMIYSYLYF
jgi:hypothetical protein